MSKFKSIIRKVMKGDVMNESPEIAKVPKFDLSGLYGRMRHDLRKVREFEGYNMMVSDGGKYIHVFLTNSADRPVLYSSFEHSEGFGIFEKSIYQDSELAPKGLARRFYTNYLIPKFSVIISDKQLTHDGFKFYEKLFDSLNVRVIDTETKQVGSIDSVEEMDEYFTMGSGRYRFMLTKR